MSNGVSSDQQGDEMSGGSGTVEASEHPPLATEAQAADAPARPQHETEEADASEGEVNGESERGEGSFAPNPGQTVSEADDTDSAESDSAEPDSAGPEADAPGERDSDDQASIDDAPVVRPHFVAPALLSLDQIADDDTFLIRSPAELEDVAGLATELARLGQLFPIDVRATSGDRFQIVCGFRRVAALRFLKREKVLARLHAELSDSDATLMALASAAHHLGVDREELERARERLEEEGRLTAAARDLIDRALRTEDELAPEQVEEEVDADELASDVTVRLGQANQDLALLAEVFGELEDERKDELLKQLRYSIELVRFLESKG